MLAPFTVSGRGAAELVVPVPPLPAGLQLTAQPWLLDLAGNRSWLGNDSTIVVR